MMSRGNNIGWMGEREEEDSTLTWNRNISSSDVNGGGGNMNENNRNELVDNVVDVAASLSSFKSMLEVENEWYNTITTTNPNSIHFSTSNEGTEHLLLHNIDSSSSCTPSPSVFNSTALDPNHHLPYFFSSKSNLFHNPLTQGFGIGCGSSSNTNNGFFQETHQNNNHQITDLVNRGNGGVLGGGFGEFSTQNEMGTPNLGNNHNPQFSTPHLVQLGENEGFGGVSNTSTRFRAPEEGLGNNNTMFGNRTSKILKPLDNSAPVGSQPTLFQKRAALRKTGFNGSGSSGNLLNSGGDSGNLDSNGVDGDNNNDKKRKFSSSNVGVNVLDNVSLDGSFNYDSDDFTENNSFKFGDDAAKNGVTNSNNNSTVTGGGGADSKGKKKGLPAKNLMAERRRRKKLNDRLYMLRSVVPKISKMDRASILGDAIEYLKELLQKINDLHNELESTPPPPSLTQTTNLHPLTPTLPSLPSRIKEELCPSSLPSPNGQPARIEVRLREGRAVNIHMFCGRRPGLLLSTMRALDGLGLDIQQAVISCFNGFAMDIFRAEQCKEGQDLHPDQIKALLLDLATFHGSAVVGNCSV